MRNHITRARALLAASALMLAITGPALARPKAPQAEPPQAESAQLATTEMQFEAIINSPLRSEADRHKDARRKPAEFLAFAQVTPGMKVLELGSGSGATAVLLALAVGPDGEVWAHNSRVWPELDARVVGGTLPTLRLLVGPFENPIPKNMPPLDLIVMNMAYHDVATFLPDRSTMNQRLYAALKPGGHMVIIDNAGKPGSGVSETNTLHRIDEETVVAELIEAGFTLDARGDYLRAPSDPRELPYFRMEGAPDDKFALRFVKK
jgi:predicted methyltransferase